ncbi:hypothetical protein C2E23DRAFT_849782 [Lenzites betulinus]|nr:hypothetical protein C2E23DRAFT_849782 [Lenzites betulinus]
MAAEQSEPLEVVVRRDFAMRIVIAGFTLEYHQLGLIYKLVCPNSTRTDYIAAFLDYLDNSDDPAHKYTTIARYSRDGGFILVQSLGIAFDDAQATRLLTRFKDYALERQAKFIPSWIPKNVVGEYTDLLNSMFWVTRCWDDIIYYHELPPKYRTLINAVCQRRWMKPGYNHEQQGARQFYGSQLFNAKFPEVESGDVSPSTADSRGSPTTPDTSCASQVLSSLDVDDTEGIWFETPLEPDAESDAESDSDAQSDAQSDVGEVAE